MALLDSVKLSLRIKNAAFDTDELAPMIAACKIDLGLAGIKVIEDTDPLIQRAVILYAKANFGLDNENSEKYQKSYDTIKNQLSVAPEYNELVDEDV